MRSLMLAGALILLAGNSQGQGGDNRVYLENFDQGDGGWYANRISALPVWDGVAYCHGPWFLDPNHAPPGAGYLHLVMWLFTDGRWYQNPRVLERVPYTHNSFVEQGFGTRLSNARLTIRMRGEVDAKGAQLLLLAQAETDKTTANMVLSGQPFKVTKDWSEQTVTLVPDPEQWTCLGSRHDSTHKYGCDDIARVLEDVNVDIIFVWFPLDVVPRSGDLPDMHIPRAGQDYPVDRDRLPKGLIMFDYVKLQFSE